MLYGNRFKMLTKSKPGRRQNNFVEEAQQRCTSRAIESVLNTWHSGRHRRAPSKAGGDGKQR